MIELGFRRHLRQAYVQGGTKYQVSPLPVGGDTNTTSQPFTKFTATSCCRALNSQLDYSPYKSVQTDLLVVAAYSAYTDMRNECQNYCVHVTKQI